MSFNQISNINLFSKDSKKLIQFYRDVLGIPEMKGQDEDAHWYGFQTEGVELAIEPVLNKEKIEEELNVKRSDALLIQFKASTLEELIEMSDSIEKRGVKLLCTKREVILR